MSGRRLRLIATASLISLLLPPLAHGQAEKSPTTIQVGAATVRVSAHSSPYSPASEWKALQELQKKTRERVRELRAEVELTADGLARRDLERRIIEAKRNGRLEFLRTKAAFARGRRDFEAAARIELIIERVLEPQFSAPVSSVQKHTENGEKGGPR
jgi:hypothetical protein